MSESMFQIPGTSLEQGETIDVPKIEVSPADVARRGLDMFFSKEYKPTPEQLRLTRSISTRTHLQVTHRSSVAIDGHKQKAP